MIPKSTMSGSFYVHQNWVKGLGLKAAIVLGYLIDYSLRLGWAQDDGWFCCTVKIVSDELFLSPDVQLRIMKKLSNQGLLEIDRKGIPPRRHFRINRIEVEELSNECGS